MPSDPLAFAQTAATSIEATVITDVSLVGVERRGVANLPDLTGRVFLTLAEINTHVLLISGTSAAGDFCFLIPQHSLVSTLDALKSKLHPELERRDILRLWAKNDVLIIRAKTPSADGSFNPAVDLCTLLRRQV